MSISRLTRRKFCATVLASPWAASLAGSGLACARERKDNFLTSFDVVAIDRARVLSKAKKYLSEGPITITASSCPRSAGGKHDFYSEGDYWWPDPKNPDGPYIRRDGMSNPDNFVAHRQAMMRLSVQFAALAAAWKISGEARYATHAAEHLRAWFLNESTRMNPTLQYAQAIKGRTTGRGTGIIDTIHLVEVARGAQVLRGSGTLSTGEVEGVKKWFEDYVEWMTTSKNGMDERNAKNNHGTCWVMQVAEFARLTGNHDLTDYCRNRIKTVLLPNQMAADGSFPLELKRTKPYGYSLFNLDAMATVCQILSTPADNLWKFELPDGRTMKKGLGFMVPYIVNKKSWPFSPDVMYFDQWPIRQPSLLFAGLALDRPDYLKLWLSLKPDSTVPEVIRNWFIRQPVLWVGKLNPWHTHHSFSKRESIGKQFARFTCGSLVAGAQNQFNSFKTRTDSDGAALIPQGRE
ncbi:MAG TPA: alginate lyase family protein [Terriglobia bacterium]|nr:alginate lyase family protein [Terriglobia bacterium]